MKRSWNWSLWIGFLFALAGFLSYTFFAQFPVTRDFPRANLLLFAGGGIFLLLGLFRAFGKAQVYRGKVFGPILATLRILMFGFFSYVFFYQLRQMPPSTGAPRVGQKAPKAEAIRRYDLLHGGAGPKSTNIARPAEFFIDPSGTIRWVKSDRKHCCSCASRTGAKRI
jgi:hypothetical protein